MKNVIRITFAVALLAIAAIPSALLAQHDGVIQTAVCREVQLRAQAAVEAGEPYRNKGQLQKTAAHVVDAAQSAGEIDAACASCILSQFARGIPIAEQSACGPDAPPCEPGDCVNRTPCVDTTETCVEPVCAQTTEGDIICIEGLAPCGELLECTESSACPPGWVCVTTFCCNKYVCISPALICGGATE
ncbi:MAG TPA: hypothetical protein VGB22_05890 [candidate division Zixibacteria bacterium]